MNKIKMTLSVLALIGFLSVTAHADDSSSGCGLGWQFFKKNSLVSSSFRSSTNAIASNTSGMTSGTSGCAKHDIVLKEKAALYYAEANYQKLQSEMSEGQGEHLQAFATLLGCHGTNSLQAGHVLQGNYDQVFSSDHTVPNEMLNNTIRTIYSSDLNCAFGT
jgi:hypothetical protein